MVSLTATIFKLHKCIIIIIIDIFMTVSMFIKNYCLTVRFASVVSV